MKINLLSDLHLEFADITLPGGDTLLLAGDIMVASYLKKMRTDKDAKRMKERCRRFVEDEIPKYKQTFYVMGNHEHYSGVFDETPYILTDFLKGYNVHFLEKAGTPLSDDTVLWGGTLWTNQNNANPLIQHYIRSGMNDFHVVSKLDEDGNNIGTLRPEHVYDEHVASMDLLQQFLDLNKDKKVIVMTHMAPSSKSSHPRHGVGNPLNFHYYSELSDFVLNNPQIKVWVHGHTHDSHDYMIGETRVICNPRGYAHPMRNDQQENILFDKNFSFEV